MKQLALIIVLCVQAGVAVGDDKFDETKALAEQGYTYAQNNLGLMYKYGNGVAQDYAEAIRWFRKAIESIDSPASQYNLGLMYANGEGVSRDYNEAVRWYRKAAEQGLAFAQENLGLMYIKGNGVRQDYAEGYVWVSLAAP